MRKVELTVNEEVKESLFIKASLIKSDYKSKSKFIYKYYYYSYIINCLKK